MREPNKNYVYDLSELTSDELKKIAKYMQDNHGWKGQIPHTDLFWQEESGRWLYNKFEKVNNMVNAKELFYTLENIQVDCRYLTNEQIDEMKEVVENSGYNTNNGFYKNKNSQFNYFFFKLDNNGGEFYFGEEVEFKTKITYSKFMELFAEPQHEVTEKTNDFKEITDFIASLLQYKNEKYGNSALEPLNVFQGKCKVGQRLDDKLSRVKNNNTLQKNDVADLIGYLFLVCKENNWNNFDEFKD